MTETERKERVLVSVREFARQTGLSVRQAYNLIEAREISSVRLPGRTPQAPGSIRVDQADIDAFIDAHRQPAATPQ